MSRAATSYRYYDRNRHRTGRPACAICGGNSPRTCPHTRRERDRAKGPGKPGTPLWRYEGLRFEFSKFLTHARHMAALRRVARGGK